MNLRNDYKPGLYTVTDEDTGEILIFALYGELQYSRLYELSRVDPQTGKRQKNQMFSDYA